jgi:MoaA/NifB/PqqE/SkfB family radical SAM enzyme
MKELFAAGRLAGRLVMNGLRYRCLRLLGRSGKPQAVSLELTHRCVCRCVMCNIWKVPQSESELSLKKWVELLSSRLLADLRELDITGGEPFLRDDLVSLINAVCRLKVTHLKRLRSVAITTNGVLTDRVISAVTDMLGVMRDHGLELVVVCALDAVGALHDQIRHYPGAWLNVDRSIAELVKLRSQNPNLVVGLKTTVLPLNVDELERIASYARDLGLFTIISPAILTPGRYLNLDRAPDLELSTEERLRLARFYEGGHCEWTYHARTVAGYLRTGRMSRPCTCGFNYFFVRSNGEVFLCPLFEESAGNLEHMPLASLLTSGEARRIRRRVGRAPECSRCTEPGLERYSLPCEGFAYLRALLEMKQRSFLSLHRHLGLDKYV